VIIKPSLFDRLPINAFFTTKMSEHLDFLTSQTPDNKVYLPIQKHTDKVLVLDYDLEPKIADAVITNRRYVLIGIQVADCVPILLYDMQKNVVGAVHAGWRGTAEEILKKTIKAMMDRFCSIPSDIVIAIGPGIRWCCYGVGYEVIEAITRVTGKGDYVVKRGEKYCLDLPTANKHQALDSGVKPEHIWMSDECTSCLPEKYYSYRHAKGITGRQCGFIGIV
jgi:YfiH family protein